MGFLRTNPTGLAIVTAPGLTPPLSGDASEYLSGDGTWESIPATFNFYLDTDVSDIGTYRHAYTVPSSDVEETISTVCAANPTLIQGWVTEVNVPSMLEIHDGVVDIHVTASKTAAAGTKNVKIYAELYTITTGPTVETLLGTSELTPDLGTKAAYTLSIFTPFTVITAATRLLLKFYCTANGTGTNPTANFFVEGTTLARWALTGHPVAIAPGAHAATHVTGADQLADAIPGAPGTHGLLTGVDKAKLDSIVGVWESGSVSTSGAVTATLITHAVAAGRAEVYSYTIIGTRADNPNQNAAAVGYTVVATFRRTAAGAPVQIGVANVTSWQEDAELAAADINTTISGNDVLLEVTGVAATDINWVATQYTLAVAA